MIDRAAVLARAQEIQDNAHALTLEKHGETCPTDVVAAALADLDTGAIPAEEIMANLNRIDIKNLAHPRHDPKKIR